MSTSGRAAINSADDVQRATAPSNQAVRQWTVVAGAIGYCAEESRLAIEAIVKRSVGSPKHRRFLHEQFRPFVKSEAASGKRPNCHNTE